MSNRRLHIRLKASGAGIALMAGLLAALSASAQALEHYPPLPASTHSPPSGFRIAAAPPANADIVGPPLTAIVLTADVHSVFPAEETFRQAWLPFVGQPISGRMIGEIEAGLNQRLRDANQVAVARFAPDQDLSTGIVRIAVTPIVVGRITAPDMPTAQADRLRKRLGVHEGQVIDSARFAYDLAALNRYPYRQMQAVFTPGHAQDQAPGASDLNLTVSTSRPWELYGGFKYSGSRRLTVRRYFLGGTIGGLIGRDSVLSFQAIGSPDVALHTVPHPKYKDVTANYTVPVSRHIQLEASIDIGEFNFHFNPSTYRYDDVMTSAGLRVDLDRSHRPGVLSDVRFGIEAKNEQVTIDTPAAPIRILSSEVLQPYFGYHTTWGAHGVSNDFDILTHLSPGGLDPGNTTAQFRLTSEGRMTTARYAYSNFTYERSSPLSRATVWHSQVIGQMATAPLPFSEQPALGGPALVRGYLFIDGSFDNMLIVRNEVGLDAKGNGPLKRYVFVDIGAGRDLGLHITTVAASAGIGANLRLMKRASLRLEAIHTLHAGQFTKAGTDVLSANLVVRY